MVDITVHNTVQSLLQGTVLARGVGKIHRAQDGISYEEVAASGDIVNAATPPVQLQIRNDDTRAEIVGATDGANPAGRGTYAAALVATLNRRGIKSLSLRDILGRSYDESLYDGAATINAFIPLCAANGIVITDPDNIRVRCNSPIRIQSNLKFHFGLRTTFYRTWANNGESQSLFSAASWGTDVDNFVLINGILTAEDSSATGKMISIWGDKWQIIGTQFREWWGGQAMIHGGTDGLLAYCEFFATQEVAGTGPCRMLGGRGFRGIGLIAYGGDDLFQFVPSTAPTNLRYDESCFDSEYIGCQGRSYTARVCIAAIAGTQVPVASMNDIKRCGFTNCTGIGGNRPLIVQDKSGARGDVQMDDIFFTDCHFDGHDQEAGNQDFLIESIQGGGVGTVSCTRTTIGYLTDRNYGVSINADGARCIFTECSINGQISAIQCTTDAILILRGGTFFVENNGGAGAANWIVDMAGAATGAFLFVEGYPTFREIAQDKGAFRFSGAGQVAEIGTFEAFKAAGSPTNTKGISHAAGVDITIHTVRGDLDLAHQGVGTITVK